MYDTSMVCTGVFRHILLAGGLCHLDGFKTRLQTSLRYLPWDRNNNNFLTSTGDNHHHQQKSQKGRKRLSTATNMKESVALHRMADEVRVLCVCIYTYFLI